MNYFLAFVVNSFFCGLLSSIFLVTRVIFKNISHNLIYNISKVIMFSFALPVPLLAKNVHNAFDNVQITFNKINVIPQKLQLILVGIWISVSVAIILFLFINNNIIVRRLNRWLKPFKDISDYPIYLCSIISSPIIIGFIKPRIILPNNISDNNELHYIIDHEIIHYNRRDVLIKTIFSCIVAINWFNPFAWSMLRVSDRECELSCDEMILKNYDDTDKLEYANVLLKWSARQQQLKTAFMLSFSNKKKFIKVRIENVIGKNKINIIASIFSILLMLFVFITNILFSTSAYNVILSIYKNQNDITMNESIFVVDGSFNGDTNSFSFNHS